MKICLSYKLCLIVLPFIKFRNVTKILIFVGAMKDNAGETRSLNNDYTLIGNFEFKNTDNEKNCDGMENCGRDYHRHSDQTEHFDDELIDSLHLTRKRLKSYNRRQFDEDRTEQELTHDTTIENKLMEDFCQSEKRSGVPTKMTEEFRRSRSKAA
jgi:hypothetical protein